MKQGAGTQIFSGLGGPAHGGGRVRSGGQGTAEAAVQAAGRTATRPGLLQIGFHFDSFQGFMRIHFQNRFTENSRAC